MLQLITAPKSLKILFRYIFALVALNIQGSNFCYVLLCHMHLRVMQPFAQIKYFVFCLTIYVDKQDEWKFQYISLLELHQAVRYLHICTMEYHVTTKYK